MDFTDGQTESVHDWIEACGIKGQKKADMLNEWNSIENHGDFLKYLQNGRVHSVMDGLVWTLFDVTPEEVQAVADSRQNSHAGLKNKRNLT